MEGSLQHVSLSEIGDTIGAPPSQRLLDSVQRIGVVQPVILTKQSGEDGEIHLAIVDGNRRVAAARENNLTTIPAIVFDQLEPNTIAETTLAANGFRSANYLAEFWALKHLERNHYAYNDLVAASGMSSSTIKLRSTLSGLNRELFVALRNGQIGQTLAVAAARLPAHQQQTLAESFRRTGKLTQRDVHAFTKPEASNPHSGDKVANQLASVATEAAKLGYSKAEFLEMAARIWDESVSDRAKSADQSREERIMKEHTPTDPLPDLAAHKWDTGES